MFTKPAKVKVYVDDAEPETETELYQHILVEIEALFGKINCDFSGFKFDRDEANASLVS